jgi:signal peptidase II
VNEYFNIVLAWNTGVSFSMLSGSSEFNRWALIILSLAVIRFIYKIMIDGGEPLDTIGFSMVIAGAMGNVADRIRFGAVVDFLDLHIGRYHWPAFNIADTAICMGVAILIWRQLFRSK